MPSACSWPPCSIFREQLLELCIRGGQRETIHKGALRVLRVGKDAGVRLEYFYVFSDVVSSLNKAYTAYVNVNLHFSYEWHATIRSSQGKTTAFG